MIVDCAHYQDGRRSAQDPVSIEDAAARSRAGGFVWLGLFEPGIAELEEVREAFGLHELAVEDALNFHLRPKMDNYADRARLVILRTARYDDEEEEVDFGKISVFLSPASSSPCGGAWPASCAAPGCGWSTGRNCWTRGSASALWAILDQVVDGYAPVVAEVERDIDQIEATVFSGAVAPTERIYFLRREVTNFYRAVHPLLAVVPRSSGRCPASCRPYLHDVTTTWCWSTRRSPRSGTCWPRCSRPTSR